LAVNALSLAECLRPWRNAGIHFFLVEPGETLGVEQGSALSDEDPSLLPDMAAHDLSVTAPSASAEKDAAPVRGEEKSGQLADAPSDPRQSRVELPLSGQEAPDGIHMPPEWADLYQRTLAAPLLWTYPDLGADLAGKGLASRSQLLKTLMSRLELPRGSSTFWPPQLDALRPGAACAPEFYSGLAAIKPRAVIFLGPMSCLEAFGLRMRGAFQQEFSGGRLYLLLPAFERLLSSPQSLDKAVVFLRAALSGLPFI
jgi:hypothetical protein